MKNTLLVLTFLLFTSLIFSQIPVNKPFITGTGNIVFGINENYTLDTDDGQPLIIPSAILLKVGAGYQFTKRWAASLNTGYDFHFRYDINAIPTYGSLRYNFIAKSSTAYFVETSYGKMWRPSSTFENGDYYSIGFGGLSFSDERWNGTFRIDFNRKKIAGFKNGNLDSISFGFGFTFF